MRIVVALAVVCLSVTVAPTAATAGPALVWQACPGVADARLRCTTVTVPLDHARPGGRTIEITVSRLPATDPALRRGVLFTTGGGPGGAGVPEPLALAGILDPAVLAAWHRYELDRLPAFEENYAAFTAYVAANSAAFGLGTTPAEVGETLRRAFAEAPLPAGGHAWTVGELGSLAVLATMFEQLWPVVATNLAAIVAGSPPPIPLDPRPAALPGTPGVPADNHTAVNIAFRCGDNAWPRDLATYRRDLASLGARYPVYGPSMANVNPCAFWPFGRDNTVPLANNRAPAALVVAALHDASVPLANSVATARAIASSRLVTVDRRVHVPLLSGQGNACLAGAVTTYLVDGRLPAADTAC